MFLFVPKLNSNAADLSDYGFESVTRDLSTSSELLAFIDFTSLYFYDEFGNIWHGSANDLFSYLKDNHATEINPYVGLPWGDVSRGADAMDALSFASEIIRNDKGGMKQIQNLADSILSFTTSEEAKTRQLMTLLLPLMTLFLSVYFITGYVTMIENHQTSAKDFAKRTLVNLVITWLCGYIDKAPQIIYFCSNYFIDLVKNNFNPYETIGGVTVWRYDELVDLAMKVDNVTFWESWACMATGLFGFVVGGILLIAIALISMFLFYSLHLQLAVRIIFLPIAVPNCLENPRYSSGMNYIKLMIAECLQGAMYLLVFVVVGWYESASVTALTGLKLTSLFMPIMLLTGLIGSKTLTTAIVDAIL